MVVDVMDRNGDGEISRDEVTRAVRRLVEEVIRIVDQDGDEKISPEELGRAVSPATLSRALVNRLDSDGDGELRLEDLRHYLRHNYTADLSTSLSDLGSAFSDAMKPADQP